MKPERGYISWVRETPSPIVCTGCSPRFARNATWTLTEIQDDEVQVQPKNQKSLNVSVCSDLKCEGMKAHHT